MNFRQRNQMAARRAAQRKRPDRIISILLILSLLFGNLAGFPSAAAELTSYCGKEEHVHTEECYKVAVTTEPTETEGGEETTSETTEAVEETEAAQTVILFDTPVCGKEEHTHTLKCYSNPDADVETAADWEATLPETLTGTWADDLLATVRSQVGYKESVENFIVEADGETTSGYNRYGAWYGSYTQDENQPYLPWNITFLFFSIYYSNIDDFPLEETCPEWIDSLDYYELYRAAGEYTPAEGDLVFVDTDGDGEADRVGVASEVKDNKLIAIEGDYEGAVAKVTYDLPELTVEPETTETEGTTEIDVSVSMNALLLLSDGIEEGDEAPQPTVVGYADMAQAQADAQPENGDYDTLDTLFTIYFAAPSSWSNYTVKLNARKQGDNANNWLSNKVMEKTRETYNGLPVFSVNIDSTECPYDGFNVIQFTAYEGDTYKDKVYAFNSDESMNDWESSTVFANKTWDSQNNCWVSVTYESGSGDEVETVGTVVDIKKDTFSPAANVMYVDSTFYDYYTDYELDGHNRDSDTSGMDKDNDWVVFRNFNTALSNYYDTNSVKIPLYVGHFQPEWDGWNYPFANEGLSLYGFKDGKAYGTTSEDQRYFMSVNNSHMDSADSISSGLYSYAAQGLVNNALVNDSLMSVKKSDGTAALPMFNAAFINGTNSLNKKLGDVYENVSFPFTKKDVNNNGVEYWYFDSAETTLEMKKDSTSDDYFLKAHSSLQSWAKNVDSSSIDQGTYGFFPFNSGSTSCVANSYNYGFGCRLDIPFRLTSDGKVSDKNGNKVDIVFEFSGDDDVWVFIDGQLALDIGGAHGKVTGNLNFATKQAYVDNAKINPGTNNTGSNGSKTTSFSLVGANTAEHVLTMFYMERGMWESNMKITFNFPDENQLEVEKQVDTTEVNSLFTSDEVGEDVFSDQKLFTFNIKNLATHFADVDPKGATYKAIPWDVAGSTLRKDPSNTFSRDTYHDRSNALRWYAQYDDGSSQYRHKRYGVLSLPDTINITNMAKLSFDVYVEGVSSFSLSNMYLQILDADVEDIDLVDNYLTAGNDNAMGCISSSLSGKTYGTPSTQGGTWVTITLDLSKLDKVDGFDKTRVKHLRFGYNYPNNIYLSNITFLPAAQQNNPTGFITQQYDVPSYGSATSGKLENAIGAVYTSNKGTAASYVVDSAGQFALENGELINFHDQFRRGSYIYLKEVLTAMEDALYDTTWTMYENDSEVGTFGTGTTVSNPLTTPSMVDVESTVVTDQRVEYYQTEDSSGKEPENAYKGGSNPGGFVFRSYANPDSTATTTKLRVKFTNKVNTAKLTISKVDKNKNTSSAIGDDEIFTFKILFYNVGGVGLESNTITHTVTLKAGGTTTIEGIPVNTQYAIYELQNNEDIVLDSVSGAHDAFYATTYGSTDAYMVGGSLGTTDKSVTFTNVKKPTISVKATKSWLDANGNTPTDIPDTIYLRLLYRKAGTMVWEPYVSASGFKGYQTVALTPGYGAWEYIFTPLDVYVNYPSEQTKWEYKVVELDADGNVIAENGTITIGENDYTVTYDPDVVSGNVNENGTVTNSVETQTITNKMKSKLSVKVTKVWVNGIVDNPTSVKVMLQSSTDGNNWEKVEVIELSTTNDNWTYTFENLPDKSGTTALQYRVVEVMIDSNGEYTDVVEDGGLYNVNGIDFKVSYVNAVDTIDGNQTNWTITNTIAPKVQMLITKKAANDPNYTFQNVSFKIEKQNEDGTWAFIQNYAPDGNYVTGMTPGTYRVTETQTDSGYNLLAEPILIVIKDCGAGKYEATVNGEAATEFSVNEGALYSLKFTVYNKPKLTMPATGGVNGFEFWILGGLCMMAVPLLLYTFFWFKKGGKYLRK